MMYLSKRNARALFALYKRRALPCGPGGLAAESGVPPRCLDAYFNAECGQIRAEHMAGLARALGMAVSELDAFLLDHY
jgi:hypothetical protein